MWTVPPGTTTHEPDVSVWLFPSMTNSISPSRTQYPSRQAWLCGGGPTSFGVSNSRRLKRPNHPRYCQVGEPRPNIVGFKDAPSTIFWGRIGLEALNLTIPLREARPGIRLNQRQAALVARVSSTPQADVMRGRRKTVLPVFTERGRIVQRITSLLQLLGLERRARRSPLEVAFTAASANPAARKPLRSGSLFELAGRRGFPPEDCRRR